MDVAKMIDHTALKPETTVKHILTLCEEAKRYGFYSVCVNPFWVYTAFDHLKKSSVLVCTVIGFPFGATTSDVKAFETRNALQNGAREIDMVLNIGALKSGDDTIVTQDIAAVVEQAAKGNALVKVILETSLLTEEEKVRACQLAVKAGAHFVKTSTGFSSGGATVEDIALMRKTVGPTIGVKASGGIRDPETFQKMIDAGATRIGASASVAIVEGRASDSDY
ncbi:deoxyribose-phosphate aldolase [Fictibacillus macauensis ZFHKF-1]|uniref:Deoxyribose-phosphate aldolase n=1 Tax=Fictibacillus macauensis ZFHKF-1 TaxID=1196324 RepID=I8UEI0_9BACL|nr:deoxyribose-phosphate aldolase [Fictibacillus macauensis]EIT85223.1 deoxyribose-phosphate aldolase [Fictibacillus macauensis ZFHKF-1]